MKFHQLAIATTLAVTTLGGVQAGSWASARQSLNSPAQMSPIMIALGSPTDAFSNPPSLGRIHATEAAGSVPATYEFTISVPADAGQPLKAVRITQAESLELVDFSLNDSKAYTGKRYTTSSAVPLASIGGADENPGEAMIVFARPVQPGSTVTIALSVRQNPLFAGVYNFGVTAFPEGNNQQGQFIGVGRINFYGSGQ